MTTKTYLVIKGTLKIVNMKGIGDLSSVLGDPKYLVGLRLGDIKGATVVGVLANPQIEFQVKHTDKPLERD